MLYFYTKIHHQGPHVKSYYDNQTNAILKNQKMSLWHAPVLVTCIHSTRDMRSLLLHKNVTSYILKILIIIKENTLYYSKRYLS